jgi:hypothetical protein
VKKSHFVVFTNPAEGREDEFNDWYDNQHIDDLLNIPGIVGAQRFRLSETQRFQPPYPYKYMAVYEVESDKMEQAIKAMNERVGTPEMPMTEAIAKERVAWFFEPLTEHVIRKKTT